MITVVDWLVCSRAAKHLYPSRNTVVEDNNTFEISFHILNTDFFVTKLLLFPSESETSITEETLKDICITVGAASMFEGRPSYFLSTVYYKCWIVK